MMPVGPLMIEHRLIERMTEVLDREVQAAENPESINLALIEQGIDFFRTYADRCHHGKEEDYLFAALHTKPLSDNHKAVFNELMEEHTVARATVKALADAREKALSGNKEGYREIVELVAKIKVLYPTHIEKEDKHFFIPIMDYFSPEEQSIMLEEFAKFDQSLIHEKYQTVIEHWEKNPSREKGNSDMSSTAAGSVFECIVCGYLYDPALGDPEHGIKPGTAFEDLPADWVCPWCGSSKDMFRIAEQ